MERPAPHPPKCLATAARQASRRLTQLYDEALAPVGLRSTQYAILTELERRADRPPTMGELATALVIDRSALGHNLRPLERDGFVQLTTDADDARRRTVVLTQAGSAAIERARPHWRDVQSRVLAAYPSDTIETVRETLFALATHDMARDELPPEGERP